MTAELRATSPNAEPIYKVSSNRAEPKKTIRPPQIIQRWMDLAFFKDRPLKRELSGLAVEYRILQIYSRDEGKREARISFDVGQGTQDLGFRSDVDVLFQCEPAVPVVLDVRDDDGRPTMASFVFRDPMGRVYPSPSRRLAPDFFFHPQVYRQAGETVALPPGVYQVEFTRGPEYVTQTRKITVPKAKSHHEAFVLKRWIHLAAMNWFSGDHHVHAAGCAHYESPTEGVTPADMWRHILGEDLDVGCVLSWGPCWYAAEAVLRGEDPSPFHVRIPDAVRRGSLRVSRLPMPDIFACCGSRKTTTPARPGSRSGQAGTSPCSSGASLREAWSASLIPAGA